MSATFDQPATSSDSAVLTIAIDALAAPGVADFTVFGEVNGSGASADVAVIIVAAQTITVNGRVVDNDALPLQQAAVSLWSHGSVDPVLAFVKADGTFSVPNVVAPYDVTVSSDVAFVAFGLTRTDPVLLGYKSTPQATGIVVGGSLGTSHDTYVHLTCGSAHTTTKFSGGAAIYSVELQGTATLPVDCTVRALVVNDSTSVSPTYGGYAERTVTLTAENTAGVDLTFAPVDTHPVSVNLSGLPAAGGLRSVLVWRTGDSRPITIAQANPIDVTGLTAITVSAPNDARIPVVAQLEVLSVLGQDSLSSVVVPLAASTASVALSPYSVPLAPSFGGGGIDPDTVVLTSTDTPGSVHLFILGPTSGNIGGRYVITNSVQLTGHDLAVRGAPLSHDQTYGWTSQEYIGMPSTDALTDPAIGGTVGVGGFAVTLSAVGGLFSTVQ